MCAAVDGDLAARLCAFHEHVDHERRWDDPQVAAAHRAEGESLRGALANVLPETLRVRTGFW